MLNAMILTLAASTAGLISAGEWPMYLHDPRCAAFAEGRGNIVAPAVALNQYLGPQRPASVISPSDLNRGRFDLDGDGRDEYLHIGDGRLVVKDAAGERVWQHNFEESGFGWPRVKVGPFLAGVKGLQVVCFGSHMGTGKSRGYMFAFDQGTDKARLVWKTEPLENYYAPEVIIADVDGDGKQEICAAPHYRVQIFDLETGKWERDIAWKTGRNYGFFGAYQLDDTPALEMIVVTDFVLHANLLRVDGGEGRHVWEHRYYVENSPGARRKFLHVGPDPVRDVDGDGKLELVYNLLNDKGDELWHVMVLDPLTGNTKADLPGMFLWGIEDLDGDGVAEIIATPTDRPRPRRFDTVRILKVKGGAAQTWFERGNCGVPRWNAAMPLTASTIAEDGELEPMFMDADGDGRREIILTEGDAGLACGRIVAVGAGPDGRGVVKWSGDAGGKDLALMSARMDQSCRLTFRDMNDGAMVELDASSGKAIRQADSPGGFATIPSVADVDGDGRNEILVQTSKDTIRCLRMAKDGGAAETLWEAPGHAMNLAPGYLLPGGGCVVAADLDGDGRKETLAGGERDGIAALNCLDSAGKIRWQRAIENAVVGGVEAGVDLWTVGRFGGEGEKGLDVWLSFHRHSRGSGESAVLDGRTGERRWHRELVTAEPPEGHQAMPAGDRMSAVADADGDGIDEIYNCAYTIYAGLRGDDGKDAFPGVFTWSKDCFGMWVAYSIPTPVDLDGDGKLDIFLNSSSYARGARAAMTREGRKLWATFTANEQGSRGHQAIADVDGDGAPEIACDVLDGRLLCLKGRDGSVIWEIEARGGTSNVAAGDINGDGIIEFVFTDSSGNLRAVRGTDGRGVWSLPVGDGQPILADADGDGLLEVVIVGGDGCLKVVDEGNAGMQ
ncbi:MAG TPA: hypothetical protein PL033_06525 [Candidatus Brocadiia bacterium]|nr:hypothetical protein [Candidatus Brocadiia bacterium]